MTSATPLRSIAQLCLLFLIPCAASAWQQRVHYTMEIGMDIERHSYTGTQRLVYTNNSPDTLRQVNYHLYYEAFKPGSMLDVHDRSQPGSWLRINQLAPDEQGMVHVDTLLQDGRPLAWHVDETILRADLAAPLAPGDSTVLEMRWLTRIPRLTRRGGWMSREGVEFSMSQWYPKMAEYDANGWHDDEYAGREFFGVYGTYDVAISIPGMYVLGGTGRVMNPREVRCGYEFADRDTVILPVTTGSGMKRWVFHAENVHDFAWVADPDYVHQIAHWHDVVIHVLVLRYAADVWRFAGNWTAGLMEYYSNRFGAYDWPQFTVAMAGDGGMEYPQLIMITGNRTPTSLAGVIAHELGHQWYYGMIGNNETQEAWLDEGFAQYLTDEATRNVFGTQGGPNPYHGLDRIVRPWVPERWINTEGAYSLAIAGYDEPLITYHDRFREPATAGLVYSRGEAVLRMLQYMFGDSLFDAAMRHYYDRWKFHHPTGRDFERAMEEASGMRLDWFFNEWIGTTKLCDYAIDGVESTEAPAGGYETTIRLSNRNEMIMPLDVFLTFEDGSSAVANVPVEEWRKPGVAYNLPRWKWVAHDYQATFHTSGRVVSAAIDTSTLLFDVDRTNNTWRAGLLANLLPASDWAFYRRWDLRRPMDRYTVRVRPTLWYAKADGGQIGLVADGGYAYDRYNAVVGAAYNIRSKRIDYNLSYDSRIDLLGRLGRLGLFATNADGVQLWGARVEKAIRPFYYSTPVQQSLSLQVEREVLVGPNYPNAVAPWSGGGYNTIGLAYSLDGTAGDVTFEGNAAVDASFASASEFAQVRLGGGATWRLGSFALGGNLFFGALGGAPPAQRMFNAAGATSREMHANLIQRLAMNAEPDFASRNHLVLPGDGYMLSLAAQSPAERLGKGLLDARITFGDLNPFSRIVSIPILNKFEWRVYAAGGWLFRDALALNGMGDVNMEAGAVVSIEPLAAFAPEVFVLGLDSPNPVRLSFYLPVYASSKLLERTGFAYRWAIGVSM